MAEKLTQTIDLMLRLSSDRKWRIGDQFFRLRRQWAEFGGGDCPFTPTRTGREICWREGYAFIGFPASVQKMLFTQGGDDEDGRAVRR
jgi:hypothetical protein